MIRINDSCSLEIPELEELSSFIVDGLWIEYGVNGVLPRVQIDFTGFRDEIEFIHFHIKLIVSNRVIMNCDASIESAVRNDTHLSISAYLFKHLGFVRDKSIHSYSSIKELVHSLWDGNIDIKLPDGNDLYLCQMNELNHKFLSRALCCSSAEQTFYYDLFNSIKGVQLTGRQVDLDFTKEGESIIRIKDRQMNMVKSRFNYIEEFTDTIAENQMTIAGSMVYFGDESHITLEENGIRTKIVLNNPNNSFCIEYTNNDRIEIGDILKLPLTDTVNVTCMVLTTKMYFNMSGLTVVSRCMDYDQ